MGSFNCGTWVFYPPNKEQEMIDILITEVKIRILREIELESMRKAILNEIDNRGKEDNLQQNQNYNTNKMLNTILNCIIDWILHLSVTPCSECKDKKPCNHLVGHELARVWKLRRVCKDFKTYIDDWAIVRGKNYQLVCIDVAGYTQDTYKSKIRAKLNCCVKSKERLVRYTGLIGYREPTKKNKSRVYTKLSKEIALRCICDCAKWKCFLRLDTTRQNFNQHDLSRGQIVCKEDIKKYEASVIASKTELIFE